MRKLTNYAGDIMNENELEKMTHFKRHFVTSATPRKSLFYLNGYLGSSV